MNGKSCQFCWCESSKIYSAYSSMITYFNSLSVKCIYKYTKQELYKLHYNYFLRLIQLSHLPESRRRRLLHKLFHPMIVQTVERFLSRWWELYITVVGIYMGWGQRFAPTRVLVVGIKQWHHLQNVIYNRHGQKIQMNCLSSLQWTLL